MSSTLLPKAIYCYLRIITPFVLLALALSGTENLILIIILLRLIWITG